jgi:non-specific serine/threonine protein kinase/serine/threonine-protein kinase
MTMAALQHSNIATVFAVEAFRRMPVLVVEYLAGGTLQDRIRARAMPAAEVRDLGITLADALVYLHGSGVLHRDLKPSNVGFTAAGTPKLFDLGVAARAGVDYAAGGTLLYLAPEAFVSDRPEPDSDLWALALLLAEAWIGRHPLAGLGGAEQMVQLKNGTLWESARSRDLIPDDALAPFFARALHRDRSQRFPDAGAFAAALRAAEGHSPRPPSGIRN